MIIKLIGFLLIGLAAGWLAAKIMRGKGFGFAGNLMTGVVGSIFGGVLFWLLGIEAKTAIGSLVMATGGAILFLLLVNVVRKR